MDKLKMLLKSRTFWTIVVLFLTGGFQAITNYLPAEVYLFITGGLALLASYFKISPSQKY